VLCAVEMEIWCAVCVVRMEIWCAVCVVRMEKRCAVCGRNGDMVCCVCGETKKSERTCGGIGKKNVVLTNTETRPWHAHCLPRIQGAPPNKPSHEGPQSNTAPQ